VRCPFRAHARYFDSQAYGLGYDENGPLGLPCTEPRNETLVHGPPRAARDGRDPPFSIVYKRQRKVAGEHQNTDAPSAMGACNISLTSVSQFFII